MEPTERTYLWKTSDGTRQIGADVLLFYTKASPLSNHYLSEFIVDKRTYNCLEQYLMFQKAMYFKDIITATRIMNAERPPAQKALGRTVKIFDLTMWRAAVPPLLMEGLKAKFSQRCVCKHFLQLTRGMTLAEASRTDNFYGIGFSLYAREKDVSNQANWGNNLLGKCLMDVRTYLETNLTDALDDEYYDAVMWAQSSQVKTAYMYLTDSQYSIISNCDLCGEDTPYCSMHSYLDK